MPATSIDFWFTMGSTYTFLSVMRIEELATRAGVGVRWRPFTSVRALTGATQLPFIEGTPKMRYMWRDIERRAAKHGLPMRLPVPYPAPNSVRANRVAVVGLNEGWGPEYICAAYRCWFERGMGNGGDENLRAALADCGHDRDIERILALGDSEAVGHELEAATIEAHRLGVFGSPTITVGGELFWGDDHLEDALRWAQHGCLSSD